MRYGSVCSGIEAASVAWKPLGWKPVFYSEVDPFASAVLQQRHPDVPNLGDLTAIIDDEKLDGLEAIDLLVAGTPCQSFSVAGLRAGLDDERGNLAFEFLRLARETRPRWLVWENVPGAMSTNEGRDFGAIVGGMVAIGYGVCWRRLDAQYVRVESHPRAVPQRRDRVFIVGHLGDWRPSAAVLLEPQGLRRDSPPRRKAGERVAGTINARTRGGGGLGTDFELDGGVIAFDPRQTDVLVYGDKTGPLDTGAPPIAVVYGDGDEAEKTASGAVSAKWSKGTGGPSGDECYNLVTYAEEKAPALTGNPYGDHESREGLLIAEAKSYDWHNADGRATENEDVAGTLKTEHRVGKNVTLIQEPEDPSCTGFSYKDHGGDAKEQVAPTLRSMGHKDSHPNQAGHVAVAIHENNRNEINMSDVSYALSNGGGKPGQGYPACAGQQSNPAHHAPGSRAIDGLPRQLHPDRLPRPPRLRYAPLSRPGQLNVHQCHVLDRRPYQDV